MTTTFLRRALPALALAALCLPASSVRAARAPDDGTPRTSALADAPLAAHRTELLHLAFESASLFPTFPHLKNRSRLQAAVVDACLALDQPALAAAFVPRIDNWRRGVGYADLAFHRARADASPDEVRHWTELALEAARTLEDPHDPDEPGQAWRTDRIRAKVAKTLFVLRDDRAFGFTDGLSESEAGEVLLAQALLVQPEAVEAVAAQLEASLGQGGFERARNTLAAAAVLYDRFHDDVALRARAEQLVRKGLPGLPRQVRLDLLLQMVEASLGHNDRGRAQELLDDAQQLVEQGRWLPQDRVAIAGRMAVLQHRAGLTDVARQALAAALASYEEHRDDIVDIERAGALRPLAEAHHVLGDTAAALRLYARAVEEGVQNPNARPRADDLVTTCCSLALFDVQPDDALWTSLLQVHEDLGDPW